MRKGTCEPAEEQAPRSWRVHVRWSALFLLGWLLYEATSQPGLAAAVTCAKFGWSDWRVAWWLRRVDPDWRRGRTCFWFYLAFGLWKVAVMALLFMFLLVQLAAALAPAAVGVLAAAGVGFGLSFFMTYLSLWSALRNRIKVWLGAAPHLARTRRYWPPASGQHNAAPFVTVTTLVITLWFAVFGAAQVGMVLGPGPATLVLLALLALASPLTVFVLKYLERRVFARNPEDCWPPDELGAVYQTDD